MLDDCRADAQRDRIRRSPVGLKAARMTRHPIITWNHDGCQVNAMMPLAQQRMFRPLQRNLRLSSPLLAMRRLRAQPLSEDRCRRSKRDCYSPACMSCQYQIIRATVLEICTFQGYDLQMKPSVLTFANTSDCKAVLAETTR